MHKRDVIVAAMNSRVKIKTHKYGIEIPSSINEVLRLNKENGITLWTHATNLDMSNVGIAIDILHTGECDPIGWRKFLAITSLVSRWSLPAKQDE